MRNIRTFTIVVAAVLAGGALRAQTPANDPSARLRQVLPASVAEHVIAVIAAARAHDLPAAALENRALKFAAKGVEPKDIERSVVEQANRMQKAKDVIDHARTRKASGAEVEAGAEAMRQGVDGAAVSALAKSAPSGRSLAMPLFVIGQLVDRGLPSDAALKRVQERLMAKATDADLEKMSRELPAQAANGRSNRPATAGHQGAGTGNMPATMPATMPAGNPMTGGRPSTMPKAGPPAGVPANAGAGAKMTPPAQPPMVPGSRKP